MHHKAVTIVSGSDESDYLMSYSINVFNDVFTTYLCVRMTKWSL